ncbi:unnamed protein product [Euphydryas editha]|uniref:Uncharacterized protein n=1 Tax=Euphydryas editha TaxID=104508 RepID=A0AAU9UFB6_EUPED|nr:unnamed protein product [Euphydryas editha]
MVTYLFKVSERIEFLSEVDQSKLLAIKTVVRHSSRKSALRDYISCIEYDEWQNHRDKVLSGTRFERNFQLNG